MQGGKKREKVTFTMLEGDEYVGLRRGRRPFLCVRPGKKEFLCVIFIEE